MAVLPLWTYPIEPRAAEGRAHRGAGWYDLRHIVQARGLVRVEVVGDRSGECMIAAGGHQNGHCGDD